MPNILFRTRGNSSPSGKPRVYFTCHPDDFERYFDKICEDIFKTHDCAIYYTEDMTDPIPDEDKLTDLGSMNLFVMPVTFRLLSKPNRAMDDDFAYAKKEHIPVLPFMMETGIDEFYGNPEKFGELQYINPYSHDLTEISYEEKLKKYLESVLISEEMAKRVRAAFDAYIFLSYRKKDRRYANELMRLIHAKPEFRDIAIWYDEFLTPGESFNENIRRMMKESKLFTLLVTPNLLEKPNGKPNYVMEHEYPDAREAGIEILPAEMEETDKEVLQAEYTGIPECADPRDAETFRERLVQSLGKIAREENDDDPEHNYLIGLAYLDGVDVETDKTRGLTLITKAAEAELPEAMEKLYDMYYEGIHMALDYRKAVIWAQRLVDYYKRTKGEEDSNTLTSLNNLAVTYGELGEHRKELELHEKVYALQCRILGEEHPDTLNSLSNLASTYSELGEHRKALKLCETVYTLQCQILGEEHPNTLNSLNNLAFTYSELGEYRKALELYEKVYALRCRILGEEHPDTLNSLSNLVVELGDNRTALNLIEKVYILRCRILGEEHPDTINAISLLADIYRAIRIDCELIEMEEDLKKIECDLNKTTYIDTLSEAEKLLININTNAKKEQTELHLRQLAYESLCKVRGKEHPDTLDALDKLGEVYRNLKQHRQVFRCQLKYVYYSIIYHVHKIWNNLSQ